MTDPSPTATIGGKRTFCQTISRIKSTTTKIHIYFRILSFDPAAAGYYTDVLRFHQNKIMDDAVQHLAQVVTNMEKKIDTLNWKIKTFEQVLFSENEMSNSCKMMSMMTNLATTCRKFDEILLLVDENKNEQNSINEILQLQVNLVKSKVETLRALMTKGRTIEF